MGPFTCSDMKGKDRPRGLDEARLIGCCGAYCKTCRPLILGSCKGCKLGYDDGTRDMARARCRIKVCCFGSKKLETCAECVERDGCQNLERFYGKNGWKYERYRMLLEFIREHGYHEYVRRAKNWKNSCGRL